MIGYPATTMGVISTATLLTHAHLSPGHLESCRGEWVAVQLQCAVMQNGDRTDHESRYSPTVCGILFLSI